MKLAHRLPVFLGRPDRMEWSRPQVGEVVIVPERQPMGQGLVKLEPMPCKQAVSSGVINEVQGVKPMK